MTHDFCLTNLMSSQTVNKDGELVSDVVAVKFGETGYFETTYQQMTVEGVNFLNERLGITKAEKDAMESCSMFNRWAQYDKILALYQKDKK